MSETLVIRQGTDTDYDKFIAQLDAWWGGRSMASMLPRLFFTHFAPWTYVAEQEGESIGFLCGFRSQSDAVGRVLPFHRHLARSSWSRAWASVCMNASSLMRSRQDVLKCTP